MEFKMRNFLIIVAFLNWNLLVDGFNLECDTTMLSWSDLGARETCLVQGLQNTIRNREITSVNGNTSSTSFLGLKFVGGTVTYSPKGIGKFFPNIQGLSMNNIGLETIGKADLSLLTDLRVLEMNENNLQVLESDLFESNLKLTIINFNSNNLKYVGTNLLEPLDFLHRAYFFYCNCIHNYEEGSRISIMKSNLRDQCTSVESMKPKLCYNDFDAYQKTIDDLKVELEDQKKLVVNFQRQLDSSYRSCGENFNSASRNLFLTSKQHKSCIISNGTRFIQDPIEGKIVDLTCSFNLEVPSDRERCNAVDFTVENSNTTIVAIKDEAGDLIQSNVTALEIIKQQTLFLPSNLASQFIGLRRLLVASSGLFEITPKSFEGMEELVSLNLSFNVIQEVPVNTFKDQKKLMELDLSFNKFDILEVGVFNGLVRIETLNLDGNFLSSIKVEVFEELQGLKNLFLQNNQLKFISANLLTPLNQIESVDLTNNVCVNISYPENTIETVEAMIIDNCIAPIQLNCSSDRGKHVCKARDLVIKYPKTKISNITGNGSSANPEKITVFIVAGQSIKFLPFDLAQQFPNLETIVVESSNLTTLQKHDFKGFSQLKYIEVSYNNLTSICPETFDDVPQLEYLNLSNDHIQSLPSKLFLRLTNLKILILSHNNLAKFTSDLMAPKNAIEVFRADHNQLELIDMKILRYLRKAKIIDLSTNVCIDMKYEKSANTSKALVEFTGEIYLNCSFDSV